VIPISSNSTSTVPVSVSTNGQTGTVEKNQK
jgi:hypothetical protein